MKRRQTWSRAVRVVPTPGKGRAHFKSQAEQVLRCIGSLGYSQVILKGDGEPSDEDVARDHPASQVEAWIPRHLHRGMEELSCERRVSSEHQAIVKHLLVGELRHVGWLLTHYRRKGGDPTAHEMRSGRKWRKGFYVWGTCFGQSEKSKWR